LGASGTTNTGKAQGETCFEGETIKMRFQEFSVSHQQKNRAHIIEPHGDLLKGKGASG